MVKNTVRTRYPEYARMLHTLKEGGYRVTGPRRALLRLLAATKEPLSVQELHTRVNSAPDTDEEINLVTVYRFANLLFEIGLLQRVEFGQGYYRYERNESQDGPHHHHIVCRQCGKVKDFQGCDLQNLITRLEGDTGFRIETHQLEIYGICPECLESPPEIRRTSGGRLSVTE